MSLFIGSSLYCTDTLDLDMISRPNDLGLLWQSQLENIGRTLGS